MTLLIRADSKRSQTEAEFQLTYFAELFSQSVESSITLANVQMWNMINRIGYLPLTTTESIEARSGKMIRNTLDSIEQIDSVVLIDPTGNVAWATTEALIGQNLSDREYFQRAIKLSHGEFFVGVPIIARGTGRRLTPVAWPLVSRSGLVHGVVVSSLGESYFSNLLTLKDVPEDMAVSVLASNGEAAFISRDGSTEEVIIATNNVSSLGMTAHVTRNRDAVMAGFTQRTTVFSIIAITLFATAIGAGIGSHTKSLQLADGLERLQNHTNRIRAAQREFDTVFENVGDGIVIFDENGKLARSNKKAREFLRKTDDETTVNYLRSKLPDFSQIESDFAVHQLVLPHASEEDNEQQVQCRVMKLETNGQQIAYCVLTDVSAEQRLSAARTNFVTSINHELRTPLTSLSGAIDMLQQRFSQDLPVGADKLVAMASRNADRLLILVNDILTLQAIDQGQLNVRSVPLSIDEALDEAVEINSGYGVRFKVSLVRRPTEAGIILADPDRMQQIFSNLISNAIKYSPMNGTVTIGATQSDGMVEFFVSDDGPGIPISASDKIFDRFAKPLHARGIQASGTGLGLAITKQLVERQDGTITFQSQMASEASEAHGTTFYVMLKLHGLETNQKVVTA
ncbi:ATP-binding protein [Falsihalocynthiibacter arcticus]|nr:ATP-binding protein [Falsihalocynthiibacter arcticus]